MARNKTKCPNAIKTSLQQVTFCKILNENVSTDYCWECYQGSCKSANEILNNKVIQLELW